MKSIARAVLVGFLAGITGGLFGVGGGLVAVPGLVLLLNLPQHRAHATSVTAIVVMATASATPFVIDGEVDLGSALLLASGAVVGAAVGAGLMGRVSEVALARAFVAITVVAGLRLLFLGDADPTELIPPTGSVGTALMVAAGFAAGLLAALLGVGGGLVFVPALAVVFGFPQHLAQGTSLVAIVPTTLVAAARHARHRRVDWPLIAPLGLAGVAGGLAGAMLALELAPANLRRLFVGLLVVVSLRMVRRTRRTIQV